MSGFVSIHPPSATPPASTQPPVITNEPWFPDIDLAEIRTIARIDGNITDGRLAEATTSAMLDVNKDLATLRIEHQAAGVAQLADVAAPKIGGVSRNLFLYRRAVAAFAKADLLEVYVDYDLTKAGEPEGDDRTPCAARRTGRLAVRDILGKPRTTVELI